MSQTRMPANATTRDSLIALLGADLQHVVSPLKQRICETARTMHGDYHRAALQLLADDQGRWRPAFEQQLILAALADLQRAPEAVAIVAAVRN